MNPAALAMMPMTTNNVAKQSNTAGTSSTGKFDEALNNAMVNKSEATEASSAQDDLTTEETKVIEELLAFLGVESLSELKDAKALLKSLTDSNGESETVIAELLASIENMNISGSVENESEYVDSLLSSLLAE